MLFNQEPFIDLFKCKHWSIPGHWLPSATLIISILILVFFFRVAIKLWEKSLKVPKGGRQEEDDDLHLNLRLRCSKEISKRERAELKTNQTIDNNYIQPDLYPARENCWFVPSLDKWFWRRLPLPIRPLITVSDGEIWKWEREHLVYLIPSDWHWERFSSNCLFFCLR